MDELKKPLSPHLQVYKLPLLAWLSILHRASGLFLSVAALLLPLTLITLANGPEAYAILAGHLSQWYGKGFLFILSFCLNYHLLNGIRHLCWDMGWNLEVSDAEKSAYVLIVMTLVLTVFVWVLACL